MLTGHLPAAGVWDQSTTGALHPLGSAGVSIQPRHKGVAGEICPIPKSPCPGKGLHASTGARVCEPRCVREPGAAGGGCGGVSWGASASGADACLRPCCLHPLGFRGGRMNEASRYFSAATGEASPLEAGVRGRLPAYARGLVPACTGGWRGGFGRGFATSGNSRRGLAHPRRPRCLSCLARRCVTVPLPVPSLRPRGGDALAADPACSPVTSSWCLPCHGGWRGLLPEKALGSPKIIQKKKKSVCFPCSLMYNP